MPDPVARLNAALEGRYAIERELGEGGMATVYLAEQHEPVRRQVALKVIQPGRESEKLLARFDVERQALAVMEHPSIARIFDGGVTPQGHSWFAMEYVAGEAFSDFCDRAQLPVADGLRLF